MLIIGKGRKVDNRGKERKGNTRVTEEGAKLEGEIILKELRSKGKEQDCREGRKKDLRKIYE